MDPPSRPQMTRAAPSAKVGNVAPALKYPLDGSPSPLASNPRYVQNIAENPFPRSSHTVSIGWEEGEDAVSQRTSRLQIELAECVETKTVTTTTSIKRSYPPLLLSQHALSSLDSKEYPLAFADTPPELTNFSFEVDPQLTKLHDDGRQDRVEGVSQSLVLY